MRHKYETRGIVLSRTSAGEADASLLILTDELGLIRARATSVREARARLAPALVTFAESYLMLVRGKDVWRIAGSVLIENWFRRFEEPATRARAIRIVGLLLRLVPEEAPDTVSLTLVLEFFRALTERGGGEAAEFLAAAHLLAALGLGAQPPELAFGDVFGEERLEAAARARPVLLNYINRGIAASGL